MRHLISPRICHALFLQPQQPVSMPACHQHNRPGIVVVTAIVFAKFTAALVPCTALKKCLKLALCCSMALDELLTLRFEVICNDLEGLAVRVCNCCYHCSSRILGGQMQQLLVSNASLFLGGVSGKAIPGDRPTIAAICRSHRRGHQGALPCRSTHLRFQPRSDAGRICCSGPNRPWHSLRKK